MAEGFQKHRETREFGAFAALFPAKADQFVTNAEIEPLLFDEAKYAPTTVFNNHAGTFKRHYFPQIGGLKTGARNTTARYTSTANRGPTFGSATLAASRTPFGY